MSRFKIFIVTIHIAGWLLFMAFPLLFLNGGENISPISVLEKFSYWSFVFTYVALFYFNGYLLIPTLFFRKKYIEYTLVVFALLVGVYFIKPFDKLVWHNDFQKKLFIVSDRTGAGSITVTPLQGTDTLALDHHTQLAHFIDPHTGKHFIDSTSLFIFLMIIAISTAMKAVQQWQLTEQRAARAETDKANAELSFLKAQINPHFLFNTLNNIYTLTVTHDENAADSVMKLSNIMRYVTDEVSTDFVPLQSEVDCISDYIELQRLRMNDNTPVNFTVRGDMQHKTIPPLILMTFIENIFKYGISKHEPSIIDINIDATETAISFFCQNRIFIRKTDTQRLGIGIKNTKQRLEHLYHGRHLLYITNDDEFYTVQLVLQT